MKIFQLLFSIHFARNIPRSVSYKNSNYANDRIIGSSLFINGNKRGKRISTLYCGYIVILERGSQVDFTCLDIEPESQTYSTLYLQAQ